MPLEIIVLIIVSALIVWAAISDWRTRRVPRTASYLLLLTAEFWLFAHGQYWEALFVGLATIRPAKKPWMLLCEVSGILLIAAREFSPQTIFLVAAVLIVQLLFDHKVWGGGDAQVATALVAIIPEWSFFVLLTLIYMVVVIVLSIRRFGLHGWFNRLKSIIAKFRKPIEEDPDKIQMPWVVLSATCTLIYVWVYPGFLSSLVSH